MNPDPFAFLEQSSLLAAPRLLGCELKRQLDDGGVIRVRIVEVEAYDEADEASHSYHGPTARNAVMFGPPGHLYVYFTYGMHHCMNVVTGPEGHGSGLLVRAVEPLEGLELVRLNRGLRPDRPDRELTNGPGKVTQALVVGRGLGGHDLRQFPLRLIIKPPLAADAIMQTTRIGISRAAHEPWRFYVRANPYVSKPNTDHGNAGK